jgi:hypothetical protein
MRRKLVTKTLHHGGIFAEERKNWDGRKARCHKCLCIVEIASRTDLEVRRIPETDNYYARTKCPECEHVLTTFIEIDYGR